MSSTARARARHQRARRHLATPIILGGIVLVGIALVALASTSRSAGGGEYLVKHAKNVAYDEAAQMNVPILRTTGAASGTATAGGVTVNGSNVALGRVRLGVLVAPSWTVRNTSDKTIALGTPHVDVVKGCCPGAIGFDDNTSTLAPGASTTLRFGLAMHPGMDGPHDFSVHVPAGDSRLDLRVTGDFRD